MMLSEHASFFMLKDFGATASACLYSLCEMARHLSILLLLPRTDLPYERKLCTLHGSSSRGTVDANLLILLALAYLLTYV